MLGAIRSSVFGNSSNNRSVRISDVKEKMKCFVGTKTLAEGIRVCSNLAKNASSEELAGLFKELINSAQSHRPDQHSSTGPILDDKQRMTQFVSEILNKLPVSKVVEIFNKMDEQTLSSILHIKHTCKFEKVLDLEETPMGIGTVKEFTSNMIPDTRLNNIVTKMSLVKFDAVLHKIEPDRRTNIRNLIGR